MDFIEEYFLDVLKNHYADFDGYVGRRKYWYFVLIVFAIGVAISFVGGLLSIFGSVFSLLSSCLTFLVSVALLIPNLGLAVRRLRDAGFNPLLILIAFIPVVNLALLVMLLMPTKVEGNEYRK